MFTLEEAKLIERLVRYIKNLLIIVTVTVLVFLALEYGGKLAIWYYESKRPTGIFGERILNHHEPLLGFALKRNIDEDLGGWRVKTNSFGFRSDNELSDKDNSEYRLFVVGGSTVFGWGVGLEHSIPYLLQQRLREKSSHVQVINAGVPWYASWHETALILFRLLALRPDAIIIADGLNDVAQGISPDWLPVHMGFLDPPTRIAYQKRFLEPEKRSFLLELLDVSHTFQYFRMKTLMRNKVSQGVYHPELWEQYAALMENISIILKARKIHFHVFFQPVICLDKPIHPQEEKTNFTNTALPQFADTFRHTYLEGENKMSKLSTIPWTSLRSTFKDVHDPIYLDGQHYNSKGNKILADLIAKELYSYVR